MGEQVPQDNTNLAVLADRILRVVIDGVSRFYLGMELGGRGSSVSRGRRRRRGGRIGAWCRWSVVVA